MGWSWQQLWRASRRWQGDMCTQRRLDRRWNRRKRKLNRARPRLCSQPVPQTQHYTGRARPPTTIVRRNSSYVRSGPPTTYAWLYFENTNILIMLWTTKDPGHKLVCGRTPLFLDTTSNASLMFRTNILASLVISSKITSSNRDCTWWPSTCKETWERKTN
jgi:hypothetical protein